VDVGKPGVARHKVKAEQTVFYLEADDGGQGYVDVVLICLSLYPILTRRTD
jgi:hypothetical protein